MHKLAQLSYLTIFRLKLFVSVIRPEISSYHPEKEGNRVGEYKLYACQSGINETTFDKLENLAFKAMYRE